MGNLLPLRWVRFPKDCLPGSVTAFCWEYPVGLYLGWEVEHGLSTPCSLLT